jgi:UDP-GlcNAc:undecaprenyl-phosphate GlcNAc-1-phosphate transferase
MDVFSIFLVSFFLGIIFVYTIRYTSRKMSFLVEPRNDRWHHKATPTLGGVGVYFSVVACILVFSFLEGTFHEIGWGLLLASSVIFIFGLVDDIKHLSPQAKLLGQFLAASIAVFSGLTTSFFTPRIGNSLVAQFPNIVLTFVWLIGITNAINLLDNMDGLAAGISIITAIIVSYFFWKNGDTGLLLISLAVTGSTLGFLMFNFPPASIFMGDSGSMFLGFTLAVLAIARQPQASNVFAVMGVPTLLFLLPIVDTILVTVTRLLRGQSPMQGGKDHTSHRLIAFGFNERQAVFVLYAVAGISGIVAIVLESLDYDLSLLLIPVLIISLALFTAYLGKIKVITSKTSTQQGTLMRLMVELAYRQRLFEIILDFFLISVAFYMAFWVRNGFRMSDTDIELYLRTLPVALVSAYLSFFVFGVYRGVWRYIGFDNLFVFIKSTLAALVPVYIFLNYFYSSYNVSTSILLLFGVFLLFGLVATRSSFKIFDMFSRENENTSEELVILYGTEDTGELALRWIQMNPQLGYKAVGFVDENRLNIGRRIHGVEVLGCIEELGKILSQKNANGLIVTIDEPSNYDIEMIKSVCLAHHCWIRTLYLEFKLLEY